MNKQGSSSTLTRQIKDVIYKHRKKSPDKKPKDLLNDINEELLRNGLRNDRLALSTLYKELNDLIEERKIIELKYPLLDKAFNLGTFTHHYAEKVDSEGLEELWHTLKFYKENFPQVTITNREAFWLTKVHKIFDYLDRNSVKHPCYPNELLKIAKAYAYLELYSEETKQPFDTTEIDQALLSKEPFIEFGEIYISKVVKDPMSFQIVKAIKKAKRGAVK